MLGGNGKKGHAEKRVWARSEHFNFRNISRRLSQRKLHPRPFAPPDPIGLHQLHAFRPAVQPAKRFQQIRRKLRDAQEPLAELLFLDQRARTPTTPINHLFIGEHRTIHRVPIHPALLALHQPHAPEIQQQFLLTPVIFHIASREFPRPIQRKPHALQFRAHIGDIVIGPFGGVDAAFARCVFRRQAKSVPAHGVHHQMPACALIARHHIAQRVVAHMAHMDLAAGVGEHLQHIVFPRGFRRHIGHHEAGAVLPSLLPARLGSVEIVTRRGFLSRYGGIIHVK